MAILSRARSKNQKNSLDIGREVVPFIQVQNVEAFWPLVVVFAVCSSATFWLRQRYWTVGVCPS